jgi:hypothetical protein
MKQRVLHDAGAGTPASARIQKVRQRHHAVLGRGHPLPFPAGADLDPVHAGTPPVVAVQDGRVGFGIGVRGP